MYLVLPQLGKVPEARHCSIFRDENRIMRPALPRQVDTLNPTFVMNSTVGPFDEHCHPNL